MKISKFSGPLEDGRDLAGAGHPLDRYVLSDLGWEVTCYRGLHTTSQPSGRATGNRCRAWAPIKALYICIYDSLSRRHLTMPIDIISYENWEMESSSHAVS